MGAGWDAFCDNEYLQRRNKTLRGLYRKWKKRALAVEALLPLTLADPKVKAKKLRDYPVCPKEQNTQPENEVEQCPKN